jgi:hypothetical protein
MAKNGTRAGHGWAISAAFIGQVGIFMATAAVLTGAATQAGPVTAYAPMPMPVAIAAPPVTAPGPAIGADPQANVFPYTVSVYGQGDDGAVSDVYPRRHSAVPEFLVMPGHQVGVKLSVTIPGDLKLNGLWLTFTEVAPEYLAAVGQTVYEGAPDRPLAPGPHTFAVSWPGSGSGLQPGTRWLVFLHADSNDVSDGSPIATVIVAGTPAAQLP